MARPSSYTPEVAETILQRIMCGEMLTKICEEEDMPTRKAFYAWMTSRSDLKDAYARARLAWADYWAEKVISISLDDQGDFFIEETGKAVADHARIQRHRLQTDNIKWLVGKYAPRTYGDKPVDDTGEPKALTITWASQPARPPDRYEPPRQIPYRKPELPGDLTEQDWSVMLEVLELVKRTVPTNDGRPPAEIFGVLREALLAHFREQAEGISA